MMCREQKGSVESAAISALVRLANDSNRGWRTSAGASGDASGAAIPSEEGGNKIYSPAHSYALNAGTMKAAQLTILETQ